MLFLISSTEKMHHTKKKVLIAPLDWGLGHATRVIPIIHKLLAQGFDVLIAADRAPLILLQNEFPKLPFIRIQASPIRYSQSKYFVLPLLLALPKIAYNALSEHIRLRKIIKLHQIDIVISDNRFGLWHKEAYCVFITHQIHIRPPKKLNFTRGMIRRLNFFFLRRYNEVWIPDLPTDDNLSGSLSHALPLPAHAHYIGLLSRFENYSVATPNTNYGILVILSGPEPQRSILEQKIIEQIQQSNYKSLLVGGQPDRAISYQQANIHYEAHLPSRQLADLIVGTPIVISRSGYSSVMDYVTLGQSAILIPTPGQTEQEYLAARLSAKKYFVVSVQEEFDLQKTIRIFEENKTNIRMTNPRDLLMLRIKKLSSLRD